jgi:enoyl-[acyl-carrier protein] reductase I
MGGKKVLVMGLRNKWSIAWGITKRLWDEGAELAFTYEGDREEAGVRDLVKSLADETPAKSGQAECALIKCNLGVDAEIEDAFAKLGGVWNDLDGVVHAVAHARTEDLQNDFILTSRDGFLHALNISAYTLVYVSRLASKLMTNGSGSILTLTYMGSERVFPGYNVMGVAKAALEASVRYLAHDLGPKGIRVNAISAGPIKTLSSKGVKNFNSILNVVEEKAPLRRRISADEVGGSALYLLSDMSSAVTGAIHYVDCGFNIMGT